MVIKGKAKVEYHNGTTLSPKGKYIVSDTNGIFSIEGGGSIEFDRINVDVFSYKGMVKCVDIVAKNNVSISGAVKSNAIKAGDNVTIVFSDDISLKEIDATSIVINPIDMSKIKNKSPLLTKLLGIFAEKTENIHAKITKINGSNIQLTDCDADIIECDSIKLSGHCKIKKLVCNEVKIIGDNIKITTQEKKK